MLAQPLFVSQLVQQIRNGAGASQSSASPAVTPLHEPTLPPVSNRRLRERMPCAETG
jgi:hypothetical protein